MNRRLHKLHERKKALLKHSEEILDAADKENRDLTEDETKTLELDESELKDIELKMERENKLMAHLPVSPADTFLPDPIVVKPSWEDDPKKGFRSTQEFFNSVMDATQTGHTDDERLKYLSGRRSGFLAAVGSDEAGTYSDPYGGFLVPSGFMPSLLSIQGEGDPTAGRTMAIPMASPKVTIPARTDQTHSTSVTGGLAVYRRSETQTVTASRMTFEQVELSATPLMGLSYATEELISDSAISFVALLEAGFRDEFASKILSEKINGTGAGTMEGILNADCLQTVAKETGQVADTIVWNNLVKMRSRCWGYSNAIWLYNHDALPQLMSLVLPTGTTSVPMWQTSAREGEPDMLFGRPAFATEYCDTIGDVGDIILGNWSQYLEGTYQPLQGAESLHVRFEYNERTFRFLMRNDGRCWWRTYLTPKNSTNYLSPFVVVAAR